MRATLKGRTLTRRYNISGVEPHTNIISYKTCQVRNEELDMDEGCMDATLMDTIDQVAADRVDVMNYSIDAPVQSNSWEELMMLALHNACQSGIVITVVACEGGYAVNLVARAGSLKIDGEASLGTFQVRIDGEQSDAR